MQEKKYKSKQMLRLQEAAGFPNLLTVYNLLADPLKLVESA